jgi:hypothetical protein
MVTNIGGVMENNCKAVHGESSNETSSKQVENV